MKLFNLHAHTVYSDGKNTPEEMVEEAIRLGFSRLGFSDHSFLSFDTGYCMPYEKYEDYKQELARLKEKHQGRLDILTGIEQDFFSDHPAQGFDYIIGSAHYIKVQEEYICVDYGREKGARVLTEAAARYFDGDIYALIEQYYETISEIIPKTGADIIGHFDVLTKSNRDFPFFDPAHPRYEAAWKKAADRLLQEDPIFEINVSPILRGFLDDPHPARPIISYLRSKGARLIYSGDSHSVEQLKQFAEYMKSLR